MRCDMVLYLHSYTLQQRDEPLSPLRGVCNANGLDRTFNIGAFALTGCLSLLIERLTLYPLAGVCACVCVCVCVKEFFFVSVCLASVCANRYH
jgi:hypothetical protein